MGMGWIILRTNPRSTIGLARSLAEAGIEAWTPVQLVERCVPRKKVRREIEIPILPTFVFARYGHLTDLLALSKAVTSEHPAFSVFRWAGKVPEIGDSDLRELRAAEQTAREQRIRRKAQPYKRGESVRVPDGIFAGMSGVVEGGRGKFNVVAFGGRFRVRVASWHLVPDEVTNREQPVIGAAA